MATMATGHLHANRPRLEVHLVVNDEDFLGSDLVCGRELADGATARVHVRLRLGKQQLLATVLHVRDKCAALVAKQVPVSRLLATGLFDELVQMKYTVPNDDLSKLDELQKAIDTKLAAVAQG